MIVNWLSVAGEGDETANAAVSCETKLGVGAPAPRIILLFASTPKTFTISLAHFERTSPFAMLQVSDEFAPAQESRSRECRQADSYGVRYPRQDRESDILVSGEFARLGEMVQVILHDMLS